MVETESKCAEGKPINLFDELLKRRDEYREMIKNASMVVKGDGVPQEKNRMGLHKWYLHPSIPNLGIRSLLIWIQLIPPGSRSGKLKSQGGQIHIVFEGQGYTVIDGVRYDWKQYDAIFLPLLPGGTVHQHFNADHEKWARLLCAEPNLFDALGVDKGAGFEVLQDSPDYEL